MKVVMAITSPQRLDSIRTALHFFGADQMTVTKILQSIPRSQWRTEIYHGVRVPRALVPRVRLEIVAGNLDAYDVMRVIASAAAAEPPAEATVWIVPVYSAFAIRTGMHQPPTL